MNKGTKDQQNKGTKEQRNKGTKKQKVHPIASGITRSPGLVSIDIKKQSQRPCNHDMLLSPLLFVGCFLVLTGSGETNILPLVSALLRIKLSIKHVYLLRKTSLCRLFLVKILSCLIC